MDEGPIDKESSGTSWVMRIYDVPNPLGGENLRVEGHHERDHLMHAHFFPPEPKPIAIETELKSVKLPNGSRYTPDKRYVFPGPYFKNFEIKPESVADDEDYLEKIDLAQQEYARRGQELALVTPEKFHDGELIVNLRRLFPHRTGVSPTPHGIEELHELVKGQEPIELGELVDKLAARGASARVLWHQLSHMTLETDLTRYIDEYSSIRSKMQ